MESKHFRSTGSSFSNDLVGVVSPYDQTLSISSEGLIEYDEVQVANPIIRLFAEFVVNVMNEFLSQFCHDQQVSVSSAAYIATDHAGGCVTFRAIHVDGDAACALLARLRYILQALTEGVTGTRSLFDQSKDDSLDSEELNLVHANIEQFVERYSGKRVQNPFVVQFDLGDEVVLPVQGRFRERALRQRVTEDLEGFAWPDGFSEYGNKIQLIPMDAEGRTEKAPLVFQATDVQLLRVAAEGNFRRQFCWFRGVRSHDSAGKNEIFNLLSLQLCNEEAVNGALFKELDHAVETET